MIDRAPTGLAPVELAPADAADTVDAALAADGAALGRLIRAALRGLEEGRTSRSGPLPVGGQPRVDALVDRALSPAPLPDHGLGAEAALSTIGTAFASGGADPNDPWCIGHLHCPPLAVAVAAEVLAAALNQSLDSWDQGPLACELERRVVSAVAELVGFGPGRAGGVVTTGGTESNQMAIHLARARLAPDERLYVVCSDRAHFSIARGAAILGMDPAAVVGIPANADHRADPVTLKDAIASLGGRHRARVLVVATAGTTDAGRVDPLPRIAEVVREAGAWLHVDAAYGGGALFSDRLAPLLTGLSEADSVGLDFHKLGWQPAAAGMFLTADRSWFDPLEQTVGYLNPPGDEAIGLTGLLNRSFRTTRRADVVKLAVTFQALGRAGLGALVDRCHALARYAADRIEAHPALRLLFAPELTTVLFDLDPDCRTGTIADDDSPADRVRRRALLEGKAVLARAEVNGGVALKLTVLNPRLTPVDIDALLDYLTDDRMASTATFEIGEEKERL